MIVSALLALQAFCRLARLLAESTARDGDGHPCLGEGHFLWWTFMLVGKADDSMKTVVPQQKRKQLTAEKGKYLEPFQEIQISKGSKAAAMGLGDRRAAGRLNAVSVKSTVVCDGSQPAWQEQRAVSLCHCHSTKGACILAC